MRGFVQVSSGEARIRPLLPWVGPSAPPELDGALHLLDAIDLPALIDHRPHGVIARADLVTDMRSHGLYYNRGIQARQG